MLDRLKTLLLGRPAEKPPQEVSHPQAHLTVRQDGEAVQVDCDFAPEPLARVRGTLAGSGTVARTEVAGRETSVVTLPVEHRGSRHVLTLTCLLDHPGPGFERVRATRRLLPAAGQALEVAFARGEQQCRYLLEMPLELEPLDFQEFARTRAIFDEVPPVAQIVAFLRATLHHRRTTLRSLATMARRCKDEQVQETVALLEAHLSQGHDFTNPGIKLCAAYLESKGRTVYANTVAALCLLADIWMKRLGPADLTALVERETPLPTSPEAARAVVGFFGVKQSNSEWKKLVGKKIPEAAPALEAEAFLKKAVGQRTALTILEDLAEDSGSERSRSRVSRLLARVPFNQVLVNDEHEALRSYLAGISRPIQRDTVAALGIYVDFEAGLLSEDDIDSLAPQRGFFDTSLYGMVAISGAFDAELRAFRLPESAGWSHLAALAGLSEGGLIARFLEPGAPGYLTCHLADAAAVEACRQRGLRLTGQVLARLPVLEHLDDADLRLLVAQGRPLLALFGSEEHHYQWRLPQPRASAGPAAELLRGEFSFLDGHEVFHFHDRAMARLVPFTGGPLAVYRDARGKLHFGPGPGLEPTGQQVEFPDLTGCPEQLWEPSHDYLLGRPDARTHARSRLQRIYQGLVDYLQRARRYHPLEQRPAQWQRLHEGLHSPWLRAVVLGIVDAGTRNGLVATLEPAAAGITESMLQSLELTELVEFPVLRTLFELCSGVPSQQRKYYSRNKFIDLLLDRLFAATDSEDPVVRMLACRMLGSDLLDDEQRQLAASYVLSRLFDHDRPSVARAAARSLSALALQEAIPLPSLVQLNEAWAAVPAPQAELDELLASMPEAEERARPLAQLLAALNHAFREDGSLAEERWLFTAASPRLEAVALHALECWQELAASWVGDSEAAAQAYADRLPELRAATGQSARRDAFPFLGGITGAVRLFRLDAGLGCQVLMQDLPTAWFLHLADTLEDRPEIVRWRPTHPPTQEGTWDGAIHAHELEVFREGRFVPLIEPELLRATASPQRVAASAPAPMVARRASLEELAAAVARVFNLPAEQQRAVWTMLAGLVSEGLLPV